MEVLPCYCCYCYAMRKGLKVDLQGKNSLESNYSQNSRKYSYKFRVPTLGGTKTQEAVLIRGALGSHLLLP